MKLMPIKQAQAKLANATADKGLASITLHTFKKDRSLTLRREGGGWLLEESGFEESSTPLPAGAAGKRMVKEAFKREFPHSTRAYVTEKRAQS